MGDAWEIKKLPYSSGIVGFHLVLNPQTSPAPAARIGRPFMMRGMPMSDTQLRNALKGRADAISTMGNIFGHLLPGLGVDKRKEWAEMAADALLDQSINAQLAREAPSLVDTAAAREQSLMNFQRNPPGGTNSGMVESLIRNTPVGATFTLHF